MRKGLTVATNMARTLPTTRLLLSAQGSTTRRCARMFVLTTRRQSSSDEESRGGVQWLDPLASLDSYIFATQYGLLQKTPATAKAAAAAAAARERSRTKTTTDESESESWTNLELDLGLGLGFGLGLLAVLGLGARESRPKNLDPDEDADAPWMLVAHCNAERTRTGASAPSEVTPRSDDRTAPTSTMSTMSFDVTATEPFEPDKRTATRKREPDKHTATRGSSLVPLWKNLWGHQIVATSMHDLDPNLNSKRIFTEHMRLRGLATCQNPVPRFDVVFWSDVGPQNGRAPRNDRRWNRITPNLEQFADPRVLENPATRAALATKQAQLGEYYSIERFESAVRAEATQPLKASLAAHERCESTDDECKSHDLRMLRDLERLEGTVRRLRQEHNERRKASSTESSGALLPPHLDLSNPIHLIEWRRRALEAAIEGGRTKNTTNSTDPKSPLTWNPIQSSVFAHRTTCALETLERLAQTGHVDLLITFWWCCLLHHELLASDKSRSYNVFLYDLLYILVANGHLAAAERFFDFAETYLFGWPAEAYDRTVHLGTDNFTAGHKTFWALANASIRTGDAAFFERFVLDRLRTRHRETALRGAEGAPALLNTKQAILQLQTWPRAIQFARDRCGVTKSAFECKSFDFGSAMMNWRDDFDVKEREKVREAWSVWQPPQPDLFTCVDKQAVYQAAMTIAPSWKPSEDVEAAIKDWAQLQERIVRFAPDVQSALRMRQRVLDAAQNDVGTAVAADQGSFWRLWTQHDVMNKETLDDKFKVAMRDVSEQEIHFGDTTDMRARVRTRFDVLLACSLQARLWSAAAHACLEASSKAPLRDTTMSWLTSHYRSVSTAATAMAKAATAEAATAGAATATSTTTRANLAQEALRCVFTSETTLEFFDLRALWLSLTRFTLGMGVVSASDALIIPEAEQREAQAEWKKHEASLDAAMTFLDVIVDRVGPSFVLEALLAPDTFRWPRGTDTMENLWAMERAGHAFKMNHLVLERWLRTMQADPSSRRAQAFATQWRRLRNGSSTGTGPLSERWFRTMLHGNHWHVVTRKDTKPTEDLWFARKVCNHVLLLQEWDDFIARVESGAPVAKSCAVSSSKDVRSMRALNLSDAVAQYSPTDPQTEVLTNLNLGAPHLFVLAKETRHVSS